MAPSLERKRAFDDLILTISDNDNIVEEEVPIRKKAKTGKPKKAQKRASSDADEDGDGLRLGVWGLNDDDDGLMDSDFEFMPDGTRFSDDDEFEGWVFGGSKQDANGADKKRVDLDSIIQKRRGNKEAGPVSDAEENEENVHLDLDDDEDEVLADDAFGMETGPDAKDSEDVQAALEGDEEEATGSDDDSIATPVDHPDDVDQSQDSDDEAADAEEEAKRRKFFAREEAVEPGKKKDSIAFQAMSLSRPILRGLQSVGFIKPTPIQAKTIPIALMGKDIVGGAVTGSGKTAAFVVPILERLIYRPKKVPTTRVVILTPTRELAIQCHAVAKKLAAHTDIKFSLIVGGLSLKVQEEELRRRPDVVIGTPGRFIDHMRNSSCFETKTVEILVLDEADRMLEDGFADELNEILTTLPRSRQTMLFSATMTSSVDQLIRVGLNKPVRILVDSQKKTVGSLTQEIVRLRPWREDKRMGYLLYICTVLYTERVIIFFKQKKEAHRARIIFGLLGLSSAELHSNLSQTDRIASVEAFRDGKVSYLLATDLASRGLDIKGVDTVINYDAPTNLETYIHRVGRTARAGRSGTSCTLATETDRKVIKDAVKAAKAQGAQVSSRVIDVAEADKWQAKVDGLEGDIEEILLEEKEEKRLAQVEMQVQKGENLIKHEKEIMSRPKRTWFESGKDKKMKAKKVVANGENKIDKTRAKMKSRHGGNLSNKDRKILDAKAERSQARVYKKGRAEREGKGAILNFKKGRMGKATSKPGRSEH